MTRITPFLLILITVSASLWPPPSRAYGISAMTFPLLPPHCQAWYAKAQQMGKTSGYTIPNPKRYRPDYWAKRMGRAWIPMNHYCPALATLIAAEFPSMLGSPKALDNMLVSAESGIKYQIRFASSAHSWNSSNNWLLAEAYSKLGKIDTLRGNPSKAVAQYQKAIKTRPDYTPAYMGLAKTYEQLKMYSDAIATLRAAARQRPKSTHISKEIARLEDEKRASDTSK